MRKEFVMDKVYSTDTFRQLNPCTLWCAGQSDVAHYLLEAGAVCNEYTFDGDRCHYAALTKQIRFGPCRHHHSCMLMVNAIQEGRLRLLEPPGIESKLR